MNKPNPSSALQDSQPARLAGAPRGPRKREQRREALLDAAASLFVENGVGSTTIDDIAERAGVAKGTFYHYFPDRAEMLSALHSRYAQNFADLSGEAMDKCAPGDFSARLNAWVGTIVSEYIATYALHDAIFHEPSVSHRCVMSEQPMVQNLAELLAEGEAAGQWIVEDSISLALCMFHAAHGMVDEAIALDSNTADIAPFLSRRFANMVRRD